MKLTIKEAIDQGYKYCNIEEFGDGTITSLVDILSGKEFWDPTETTYYLCEKEPRHYSIHKEDIENVIQDMIDGQENYYMEDGFDTALEGCDDLLKQLTEKINSNISKHNFYFNTDIQLLP